MLTTEERGLVNYARNVSAIGGDKVDGLLAIITRLSAELDEERARLDIIERLRLKIEWDGEDGCPDTVFVANAMVGVQQIRPQKGLLGSGGIRRALDDAIDKARGA